MLKVCYDVIKMTNLTENQSRFCEEYVANDYNGTKAYCIAYETDDKKTASPAASKLLREQKIIDEVKRVEGDYRVIGHKLGINKKLILKRLLDLLYAKKQVFFNGQPVGTMDDNAAATKAIEVLLKINGDFSPDRQEITIDDKADIDVTKMTEEERKQYKDKLLRDIQK